MSLAVAVDNSEEEGPVRRRVPLKGIVLDPDLQPREKIDRPTVERYAEMLRDGVALPPVVLVFDGEVFWLADGFHRVYGHDEAGLHQCEALIHAGTKLDAIRLSLRANAEHGRARTESDLKNAYQRACRFGLVDPGDAAAVQKLIACSSRSAERFTHATRAAREAERNRAILELKAQGLSNPKIGADERVGLTGEAVRLIVKGASASESKFPPLAETCRAEPEQIDLEDAGTEAAPDPIAAYEAERKAEARQREMWGDVLQVLQSFAKLPEPEALYANRYRKFDHALKPALDAAWNWMEAFEGKWDA